MKRSVLQTLCLDIISVFIAVFLAYSLNQYQVKSEKEDDLKEAVLNLKMEFKRNISSIDTSIYYHTIMIKNLKAFVPKKKRPFKNLQEFINFSNPTKKHIAFPYFSSIAFETAQNKNSLTLFSFEALNNVTEVYKIYDLGVKNTLKSLNNFMNTPETIRVKNIDDTRFIFLSLLQELCSQEITLSKLLKQRLKNLEETYQYVIK